MVGYSGTPLAKKLGLKADGIIALVNAPGGFETALAPLPAGARTTRTPAGKLQLVLMFAANLAELTKRFVPLAKKLDTAGMLWVAWPKKTSKLLTDLTEDVVRKVGLDAGLVDVKVCAVDETWSGLKFVYRLKDRKRA
jgi:hypothetical protein